MGAAGREACRCRAPYAAAGAGDDDHLSRKVVCHWTSAVRDHYGANT